MYITDINCDMGEGMDNDALLMPFISSANIACGYHAGDEFIMKKTIELALLNHVSIGAHPGFADKAGFGRKEMHLSSEEIYDLVTQQVYLLQKIAASLGTKLKHVKPHGALYNMSVKDASLAANIAKAVYDVDPNLVLFGLSGSYSIIEARNNGLRTASEVFADRTYCDDGSLTPRSEPNAMIESVEVSIQQVTQMVMQQVVISNSGKEIPIVAETICIHGDGENALLFAENIYHSLQKNSIAIQSH